MENLCCEQQIPSVVYNALLLPKPNHRRESISEFWCNRPSGPPATPAFKITTDRCFYLCPIGVPIGPVGFL